MYETLISAFEGLEDWQPIGHAEFIEFHNNIPYEYMYELFTNQKENCSRFINQTINEAGISKVDLDELNTLDLIPIENPEP